MLKKTKKKVLQVLAIVAILAGGVLPGSVFADVVVHRADGFIQPADCYDSRDCGYESMAQPDYYIGTNEVNQTQYFASLAAQSIKYEEKTIRYFILRPPNGWINVLDGEIRYTIDGTIVTATEYYNAIAIAEQESEDRETLKQSRVLKDDEVQGYLATNFFAEWVDNSSYLYDEFNFFDTPPPADAFPDFLGQFSSGNPDGLLGPVYYIGPSVLVPIQVGDITIFVNSAEWGNTSLSTRRVGTSPIDLHLLREQIRKLTRRSWLQDNPNLEQYAISLYAKGAEYGISNGLTLGQALTVEQQWNVPSDMIWPEYRTIDSKRVLVPALYLAQSTYIANDTSGAQVIANNASLQYDNFTVDGGAIIARQKLILNAAGNIYNNDGTITAGGELWVQAGGKLENLSGQISGGQVTLVADEIINETLVIRHDYADGYNEAAQNLASIASMGELVIQANGDISFTGTHVNANGDINIKSTGGSISLLTVPVSEYFSDSGTGPDGINWSITESASTQIQSQLSGEDITLLAAQAIIVNGGIITSQGQLQLLAGMGIYIVDSTNQSSSDFSFESSTGGLFGSDESVEEHSQKIEIVRSLLTAENDIALKTFNGDITLKAVDLATDGSLLVEAPNGAIYLQLATDLDYYSYAESSEDTLVFSNAGNGHQIETATYNELNAQGGVVFDAGTGIFVEYTGDSLTLEENLDVLAAKPGMEWINTVRSEHAAEWTQLQLTNENWDYSSQGLTKVGAALLQICMMAVAGGFDFSAMLADTAVANTAFEAAVTKALEVGASTLMTQTGHALVANGFDPFAAIEDLASEESIKNLLSSMATAVAMQEFTQLTDGLFTLDPGTLESLGFPDTIGGLDYATQTLEALQYAVVSAAVTGGSLEDNFKQQLAGNIINWVGAKVAKQIGDDADSSELANNPAMLTEGVRMLKHAALGCALGELKGNDCQSGAVGAVSAEVIAEFAGGIIDPNNTMDNDELTKQVHTYSMLGTVLIADLADRDITIAQQTGSNAVMNNYLKHTEQAAFADELNICSGQYVYGSQAQLDCFQDAVDSFQALSDQNNAVLKPAYEACINSGSSAQSPECLNYIDLASKGLVINSQIFHDLDFVRHHNSLNEAAGSYTPEVIEASLNRAFSANDALFDALFARQLGEEISVLPGADYLSEAERFGTLALPTTFESAITVEFNRMVAIGAAMIVLEESVAGHGLQAAGAVGSLLISKGGKILGQIRKTEAGDDVLRTVDGDFGFGDTTVLDAWLETTENYLKTDLKILAKTDMKHIAGGTDLRGGHILQSGNVRIKEPGTETVNPNGTISAIVEIKDENGVFIQKINTADGSSTLFPPGWSLAKVEYEITEAIKDAVPVSLGSTKYSGFTPSGIEMTLFSPPPNHATIKGWRGYPLKE
ncbi:MAG: DUF637 domain-containing protein [Gammaproteobacteria bacterium]|nr:DUF637 domain-containing protein [Gammaproteobacteria bacterium]